MFIKHPIPKKYIKTLFEQARTQIVQYQKEFDVKCSINIIFQGFNDDIVHPVKLWFNKSTNCFYLEFSNNFLINSEEKVQKLFVRYFICTNENGSFKTYDDTLIEFHKIKSCYYDATMINNYLIGEQKVKDNIYCNKCHKSFYISEDNDIYSNIKDYRCDCGGELSYTNNIEEIRSKYINPSNQSFSYNKEFFKSIVYTEEDYKSFHAFIKDKKRISRMNLLPEIIRAIDNQEYTLLNMYNLAFPKAYCITHHYIKAKYRQIIEQHCPPTMQYKKKTKKNSLFQDDIKIKKSLNRSDYSCSDNMFNKLLCYNNSRHCVKTLKEILIPAINDNETKIIDTLYNIDKQVIEKTKKYLRKYEKQYLVNWEKEHEYTV